MDRRLVKKIKYIFLTKNLCYDYSHNFRGLDPCKFLRDDVLDLGEGAPDGLKEVVAALGFV